MSLRIYLLLTAVLLFAWPAISQKDPAWDDTQSKNWPSEAKKVSIVSSADGKPQMSYFYKTPAKGSRPLIVSLHTWSGDFQQKDTVVYHCIKNGFHYIHPDFRGANQKKEALGSDLVVSDIDDAIDYALSQAEVDPENIHVMGVSGGGHATLLTYMRSKHKIRSFSAYVGIYNLIDWYHESAGRGNKYAGDIAAATTGDRKKLDLQEAKKRSPFFLPTPTELRSGSSLHLYCGIHDGYTGSVPVSQTLRLYNKVVKDFKPDEYASLIPEEYISTMVRERTLPGFDNLGEYLGRKKIYETHFQDLAYLTVFEGGHEMPAGNVLSHVPSRNILAIGDSNGAMEGGWVDQLKKLRSSDRIINTCVSGNTIGFDNLDKVELNTLKNTERYLSRVEGKLHQIIVMLGTNDCKSVFDKQFREIPENLEKLISELKAQVSKKPSLGNPEILIVSPPPYGPDNQLNPKYHGAAARVVRLSNEFRTIALKSGVKYLNTHEKLKPVFTYITSDGVHLKTEGHVILASMIQEQLESGK